ncbi:anti-CBASS protein Acb1 family protein [Consotaella aegiceratis]|uniref:anti-CBASS protein Acb1 family protein n=1 Tax=Consotaella aegiceratis TaxID=3097961 RepID=UPI002F41EAFA
MATRMGLGSERDKSAALGFGLQLVTPQELEAMYRSDWLSRKIVDIIPNDMTREWRDWQAEKPQIEAIEETEKRLDVVRKVNRALRKARLKGGAAIFIGIRGADHGQELKPETVGKDGLEYLHVLGRDEVTVGQPILDVISPLYSEPEWYEVRSRQGGSVRVHPSRIVRFVGMEILDDQTRESQQGWGDSVLQAVYDAIKNATSVQAHTASLIPEAKQDIIYMPGLSATLARSGGEELLIKRFSYAASLKNLFSLTLLEGTGGTGDQAQGERWEQKQISFAQLPELMQQYLQIACGAADITAIRLLGEAPSGLGSNGESALISYYDNIGARQRTELTPQMHRLDEVTIRSALGDRPPEIYYEWAPLWSLNEKERADVFSKVAAAARSIIGGGAGQPSIIALEPFSEALVNTIVEMGVMPGLDNAIDTYGGTIEEEPDPADVEAAVVAQQQSASVSRMQATANDAAPRTLYVSRKVLNAASILRWAKSQGFETTLPADDLHVTIAFSRAPVDWMKVGESWSSEIKIAAGGPRMMEQFGDATVLLISARELEWRHEEIERAGASWDHPEYQPHITISYGFKGDLSKVQPYQGEIVLGSEVFAEVNEDWSAGIKET